MKRILILLLAIFTYAGCGSKKAITPSDGQGKQLTLKHGGGFTGKYVTYILLENGQLFKGSETEGVNVSMKDMDKNITKQIFSNYDAMSLGDVENVTYGNLLYSITLKEGEDKHVVSWEKGQDNTDQLQLFYRNVMNQIKRNNGGVDPNKSGIKAKF